MSGGVITIFGKRFNDTKYVALCSNNLNSFYGSLTSFNFTYYSAISCYLLQDYNILNDNIITVNVPAISATGAFNFVVLNEAGYDTTRSAENASFII
jgi:hypothetical protein